MADAKVCEWLLKNGDPAVRYRIYKELLKEEAEAENTKKELLETDAVKHWLTLLKPQNPPQHWSMHHGSFDFCLENALPKLTQLGLDASFNELRDALGFYFNAIKEAYKNNSDNHLPYRKDIIVNTDSHLPYRNYLSGFFLILTANMLISAGFTDDILIDFSIKSLDEMLSFVKRGSYDIYISDEERSRLKSVPKGWLNSKFLKTDITDNYGFVYPLIYDIIGMYKLYELNKPEITAKINEIIDYISNDEFHNNIVDGYGILIDVPKTYHGMGWDPKYPGWFNVREYMETGHVPRLLFFAQHICRYPAAKQTRWYSELIECLESYKTDRDTYIFPAKWLKEQTGYANMGSHLSFGENRRKKNWCEVESTLYMQLLMKD